MRTETEPPACRLRVVSTRDALPLAVVHARCFADAWSAAAIAALIDSPGVHALLQRNGGAVTGFILCRVAADECEVLSVAVLAEARRRGLGRLLLGSALAAARARGARRAFLEVAESNQAARSLYDLLGFAPIGRRRGYYRDTNSKPTDALIMACDLGEQLLPTIPCE